jgi:hypothetical protein
MSRERNRAPFASFGADMKQARKDNPCMDKLKVYIEISADLRKFSERERPMGNQYFIPYLRAFRPLCISTAKRFRSAY